MTAIVDPTEASALLSSIDGGYSLPSSWYTDRVIFDAEIDRVHRKGWHYVTHVGELAEVGDQYLCEIAGIPIVLVRDRDGEIRGFVNICRHRAHPVVMEAGNRKTLQCHYHGWSYNLDGGLRRAPRQEFEPEFDPTGICLLSVSTYVWGPMVWVNADVNALPFPQWIDGMPELMKSRGCDVSEYVHAFENTWEIAANWKVFQDNTIECYHCPTTHPEFASAVEMDFELQELFVGGRYWIHHRIPFRKDFNPGGLLPRPEGADPWYYYYNWIFPTTYLQHYGRGFDIGSVEVVDVDRIRFTHATFLAPGQDAEELRLGKKILEVDPTIHQDVDICNRVQHAHEAGVAPPGRLLPHSEFLLSHFYKLVVELVSA